MKMLRVDVGHLTKKHLKSAEIKRQRFDTFVVGDDGKATVAAHLAPNGQWGKNARGSNKSSHSGIVLKIPTESKRLCR